MGLTLSESARKQLKDRTDTVSDEVKLNILLKGAMTLAEGLEAEIYREVMRRENKSYGYKSNEMNLLALAAILAGWSGWLFKSKSEDPTRHMELRDQAMAVSKYIESFLHNAIKAGESIGEGGGRPEGKSLFIEIG